MYWHKVVAARKLLQVFLSTSCLLFLVCCKIYFHFTCVTVCFGTPVPPADLFVLSPGYGVPPDLVTMPPSPSIYVLRACGAHNVGSNVRNDVAGTMT